MKIVDAQAFWLAIPYEHGAPKPALSASAGERRTQDAVYVRVVAEDGRAGWGEGFGFAACPVTQAAFSLVVAPLVRGREADDIPALMTDLNRRLQNMARNGPVAYALSGLDIALWDLAGRRAGRPLHELLGGARRPSIPAYASLLRLGSDHVAAGVERALKRGFRAVKLHERSIEAVSLARRALGPDLDLMLDVNCAWTREEAQEMAARLRSFGLAWLEEPIFPPDDFEGLAELRRSGATIAAGENLGNLMDFLHMTRFGAADVVQPDAAKMGGVTELAKAARLAREAGLRFEPHSPLYGPALAATLHVLATLPEPSFCEYYFADLEANPIGDAAAPVGGAFRVPDGPGLGIEVDEALLERYRIG